MSRSRDPGGSDGDGWASVGQLYTAEGRAVDENFIINETTTGSQVLDDVVGLRGGGFFATYFTNDGLDPSSQWHRGQHLPSGNKHRDAGARPGES